MQAGRGRHRTTSLESASAGDLDRHGEGPGQLGPARKDNQVSVPGVKSKGVRHCWWESQGRTNN